MCQIEWFALVCLALESVGAEHCVLGCAAFLRLSSKTETSVAQLTLLAVRKKNRRMGIGRYLMQVLL